MHNSARLHGLREFSEDDRRSKGEGRSKDLRRQLPKLPSKPTRRFGRLGDGPSTDEQLWTAGSSSQGKPFPEAIKPILDKLKARAFEDDGISRLTRERSIPKM